MEYDLIELPPSDRMFLGIHDNYIIQQENIVDLVTNTDTGETKKYMYYQRRIDKQGNIIFDISPNQDGRKLYIYPDGKTAEFSDDEVFHHRSKKYYINDDEEDLITFDDDGNRIYYTVEERSAILAKDVKAIKELYNIFDDDIESKTMRVKEYIDGTLIFNSILIDLPSIIKFKDNYIVVYANVRYYNGEFDYKLHALNKFCRFIIRDPNEIRIKILLSENCAFQRFMTDPLFDTHLINEIMRYHVILFDNN